MANDHILPENIVNGTPHDATEVMSNFNFLNGKLVVDTIQPANPSAGILFWFDKTANKLKIIKSTGEILEVVNPEGLAHAGLSDMPDGAGTNSDHDARYYTKAAHDALTSASVHRLGIKDEGISQGTVREIDFVGAQVSVTVVGDTATATISAGVSEVDSIVNAMVFAI